MVIVVSSESAPAGMLRAASPSTTSPPSAAVISTETESPAASPPPGSLLSSLPQAGTRRIDNKVRKREMSLIVGSFIVKRSRPGKPGTFHHCQAAQRTASDIATMLRPPRMNMRFVGRARLMMLFSPGRARSVAVPFRDDLELGGTELAREPEPTLVRQPEEPESRARRGRRFEQLSQAHPVELLGDGLGQRQLRDQVGNVRRVLGGFDAVLGSYAHAIGVEVDADGACIRLALPRSVLDEVL